VNWEKMGRVINLLEYLGKYKTKNKMQNCVECSYFLLDNRNRKEYECLECCLISEQMRFWAVQTEMIDISYVIIISDDSIYVFIYLKSSDLPTHLYLGQGHLELGKLAHKWCELGKMEWVILRLMNFNAIILCHWNS
jgi:hypothetical protein